MTEDDIIFDDVYELCEVISKYVFAVSDLIHGICFDLFESVIQKFIMTQQLPFWVEISQCIYSL